MQVNQEQHGIHIEQITASQEHIRASQDLIRANHDSLYQGVQVGFSYLFGEMHNAFPNYFGEPSQFP
ncbi:hypothetical protein Hanom_Chr17g01572961 [Helianthus anomalus]